MSTTPTKTAEQFLEELAAELDIPDSLYEAAERSYKSIGQWLKRPESEFSRNEIKVYVQGSFRLGTATRPASGSEDYDLDIVCEVDLNKRLITQADLQAMLGREIAAYAKAHGMSSPEPSRRCWTLNYADGAQFHIDILPAIPDGTRQQTILKEHGIFNEWSHLAVAITDNEHQYFRFRSDEWPSSNPKGYSEWFYARMKPIFEARRMALAKRESRASVEEIPAYRVKTPLQSALMILKRHRDLMFEDDPDRKPISIIITTLASFAYQQENTISGALYSILERMDQFIEDRDGITWIANPSAPRENFADRWEKHPERQEAFYEWLEAARADFVTAAQYADAGKIVDVLSPRLGRKLVEKAAGRRWQHGLTRLIRPLNDNLRKIFDAPHRRPLKWPEILQGTVSIQKAVAFRDKFRTINIMNNGQAVPKNYSLKFEAQTNVPPPYNVYWQVVNTGSEARKAGAMRGKFEKTDSLVKRESTLYQGAHSVECLIVKDGKTVARSGPFIVNISDDLVYSNRAAG